MNWWGWGQCAHVHTLVMCSRHTAPIYVWKTSEQPMTSESALMTICKNSDFAFLSFAHTLLVLCSSGEVVLRSVLVGA